MKLTLANLQDMPRVAGEFLNAVQGKKQIAFYGEMGVGKTTFIKELCRRLGVIEVVTSPTFALINEYHTSDNQIVYHFDFYRIKKTEEIFDFGYEDYFFSSHYCFIEWPDKVEEVLPDHILKAKITELSGGVRVIEF